MKLHMYRTTGNAENYAYNDRSNGLVGFTQEQDLNGYIGYLEPEQAEIEWKDILRGGIKQSSVSAKNNHGRKMARRPRI